MGWILAALISPLAHGLANVIDNYLANKSFASIWTLTFYSSALNVVFIPLVLLFQIPDVPPLNLLGFFLLIALIDVLYLFPYYKALRHEDTSIITALFSLGRIFVPLLAFLVVKEVLTVPQYLGFIIVLVASAALTYNGKAKIRFNDSLAYMVICSVLLALQAVTYKLLFENVSWSTGLVWPLLFSFLIAASFLLIPRLRRDIGGNMRLFRRNLPLLASGEILTFTGSAASLYAVSVAPVTLVKSIGSLQAFFVLLYAVAFHRAFPNLFKERVDPRNLLKKGILFMIMIGGVVLTIVSGA